MNYSHLSLGYVCQNGTLGLKCNRSMIRKNFTLQRAQTLALQNIGDLLPIFEWNASNGIRVFRISSDLFPHFTDIAIEEVQNGSYNLNFARELLKNVGDAARKYGQRVGMHPGQYNQLATPREDVWQATVRDLTYQADVLDAMGMGDDARLCVHGGGVYGDLVKTKQTWIERFHKLPEQVRRRLAIENCERCYSVLDVLEIAESCGIPVIFDCHHFECFNQLYPDRKIEMSSALMERVVATWRDLTPLFHVSQQAIGERVGTHSEYVNALPPYYLDARLFPHGLDVEVEAGGKELSVFHLIRVNE